MDMTANHHHLQVVERYPYVAMDTEFPGVVARPVGDVTAVDYQYKTLKCNVDLLKVSFLLSSFCLFIALSGFCVHVHSVCRWQIDIQGRGGCGGGGARPHS